MQNQQLGGRVYSGHARPLVHKVEHIEEIIQAQVGSSMVAALRLGGIARYPYIEDFFLNPAVSVLLLFASIPDCIQNKTVVSDTLRLLSDF